MATQRTAFWRLHRRCSTATSVAWNLATKARICRSDVADFQAEPGRCAEGHSRRARVRAQADREEIRGDWLLLRRHDCLAGGRAPGRRQRRRLLRRTDRELCRRASEGADYSAFWKTGSTYSEGERRRGGDGESRGAGLLVQRGPRLQLQRSGELQRGSGEAGEGTLAGVSEKAFGVDFPYDLFLLMWIMAVMDGAIANV